ncbi:FAD:protein FMN transferase [Pseudoclavibacter caeni]|jgi:FAD:protein FMN transferase|uniref:FAD:protein FMN transferase n=1 Tax=Pseudoclavibacter caeni TaxID=908846 RepID=A0A7C8BQK5_9MICO|nr:FAD:protein FMN transferase [Pseudoclavibacter caeni]KAB1633389.1 FAD:protein FMN transferase [Pseudoclavibacter caeni]NYJ96631.1 thiamine biosynthesis lipoprotein [Pseudoclavibacter caeni]
MSAGVTGIRETRWREWTVDVTVLTTADIPEVHETAVALVRRQMDEVARACDRFDPGSELSRLNLEHSRSRRVSPLLADFVRAALEGAARTQGALDPTLGADLTGLGLTARTGRRSRVVALRPRDRVHDWRDVRLADGFIEMPAELQLDLGATAKAQAADWSAERIAERLGVGALVNLGGDLATVGRAPADGWQVRVRDVDGDPADLIALRGRMGLATSSSLHRRWIDSGEAMHHILDPATGLPSADPPRTVSVAAPTCLEANVWATAMLARPDDVDTLVRTARHPVRVVDHDGRVRRFAGWPAPRAEVAA